MIQSLGVSRSWLVAIGRHPQARSQHLFQAILGAWVCSRARGDESPETLGLIDAAIEAVASGADLHSVDPKLLFIVGLHVMGHHGRECPAIRAFANSVAGSLREGGAVPARHAGIAAVLMQVGEPRIGALQLPVAEDPIVATLLRGGMKPLRQACAAVAAETRFGCLRVAARRYVAFRRVLPMLLSQTLRSYDLDTGAMLLRTAVYLGLPGRGRVAQAASFLAEQQIADGRFGFLASERAAVRVSSSSLGHDDILVLDLPLTATCVWALAEFTIGGGALFASARPRPFRVAATQLSS